MSTISTAASQTSTSSASTSSSSALSSLDSNFQDFLSMLMTQLQNQDPTSPMDTNQFTSELVQFSSVEQQINTNSDLSQLITATQSGEVIQGSSLVGKTVEVNSTKMPLQSSSGALTFTATSAGTTKITVADSSGATVYTTSVDATAGSNTWTWNGKTSSGTQLADGAYTVSVTGPGSSGSSSALSFTVAGKVTGVTKSGTSIELQLGSESVDFADVASVAS